MKLHVYIQVAAAFSVHNDVGSEKSQAIISDILYNCSKHTYVIMFWCTGGFWSRQDVVAVHGGCFMCSQRQTVARCRELV